MAEGLAGMGWIGLGWAGLSWAWLDWNEAEWWCVVRGGEVGNRVKCGGAVSSIVGLEAWWKMAALVSLLVTATH